MRRFERISAPIWRRSRSFRPNSYVFLPPGSGKKDARRAWVWLTHHIRLQETQLLFVESGGDNLAAAFSVELADFHVYGEKISQKKGEPRRTRREKTDVSVGFASQVIDVAGGDKVPRKGGPGISQSDLLVVNKIDIAPQVGASLEVMRRDADKMRDQGPTIFTSVKLDQGVDQVAELILKARERAGAHLGGKAGSSG